MNPCSPAIGSTRQCLHLVQRQKKSLTRKQIWLTSAVTPRYPISTVLQPIFGCRMGCWCGMRDVGCGMILCVKIIQKNPNRFEDGDSTIRIMCTVPHSISQFRGHQHAYCSAY